MGIAYKDVYARVKEKFPSVEPVESPGETAEVQAVLRAPGYDCTSIAYYKMVDSAGNLSFPDAYQLGLDVLVRVAGQRPAEGS